MTANTIDIISRSDTIAQIYAEELKNSGLFGKNINYDKDGEKYIFTEGRFLKDKLFTLEFAGVHKEVGVINSLLKAPMSNREIDEYDKKLSNTWILTKKFNKTVLADHRCKGVREIAIHSITPLYREITTWKINEFIAMIIEQISQKYNIKGLAQSDGKNGPDREEIMIVKDKNPFIRLEIMMKGDQISIEDNIKISLFLIDTANKELANQFKQDSDLIKKLEVELRKLFQYNYLNGKEIIIKPHITLK